MFYPSVDVSGKCDQLGPHEIRISNKIYFSGVLTRQATRVSRGPECLGPFAESGPVLRPPGPRGSRDPGTKAMYDDNPRGIESPDTTDAPTPTTRAIADGGTTWADLTGFQRDCLEAIARLERDNDASYGLAIKKKLERRHGEVNHGRLYPNLDTLVGVGLIEKGELDRRTNTYELTSSGRALLTQRVERLADACEMRLVATDGSGKGESQ